MWKELGLCAAVCIGSISFAAEKASVRTKDFVLRFAKDKIVLSNLKWQDEVVIRKVMFIRSPHFATPTGAEQLTPDSFKVDYKIDVKANPKDTPEKAEALKKSIEAIKLTALCTATDAGAKIEYTLTSPEYKPDGAMIEFNCWSRFKKGGKGDLIKANGKKLRPFAKEGRGIYYLALPGNPNWTSGWAEHAGFRKSGDEYKTTLEFRFAPPEVTGEAVGALFDSKVEAAQPEAGNAPAN